MASEYSQIMTILCRRALACDMVSACMSAAAPHPQPLPTLCVLPAIVRTACFWHCLCA